MGWRAKKRRRAGGANGRGYKSEIALDGNNASMLCDSLEQSAPGDSAMWRGAKFALACPVRTGRRPRAFPAAKTLAAGGGLALPGHSRKAGESDAVATHGVSSDANRDRPLSFRARLIGPGIPCSCPCSASRSSSAHAQCSPMLARVGGLARGQQRLRLHLVAAPRPSNSARFQPLPPFPRPRPDLRSPSVRSAPLSSPPDPRRVPSDRLQSARLRSRARQTLAAFPRVCLSAAVGRLLLPLRLPLFPMGACAPSPPRPGAPSAARHG